MKIPMIPGMLAPITQEVSQGFLLEEIVKPIRKDGLITIISIMALLGRSIRIIV